jgi:hypothetical protein
MTVLASAPVSIQQDRQLFSVSLKCLHLIVEMTQFQAIQPSSKAPILLFSGILSSGSRLGLLFCLSDLIGNLFSKPHVLHFRTNTSAHGFLPPLLLFSTSLEQVEPSISIVSQFLHIACFIVGDIRICTFRETERKSETRRRDTGLNGESASASESFAAATVVCSACPEGDRAVVLECCCWVARYAAAWYRNDTLLCRALFGTLPALFEVFAFVIVTVGGGYCVRFIAGRVSRFWPWGG